MLDMPEPTADAPDLTAPSPALKEPAAPPSRLEALPHRVLCGVVGVTLIVGFLVPWVQVTESSSGRITGLELAIDGATSGTPHVLLFLLPTIGLGLLVTGWWGRRRACMTGLVAAGVTILLGGAWQTLMYVAAAIGPGLWLVAACGFAALIGGLPWAALLGRRKAPGVDAAG